MLLGPKTDPRVLAHCINILELEIVVVHVSRKLVLPAAEYYTAPTLSQLTTLQ